MTVHPNPVTRAAQRALNGHDVLPCECRLLQPELPDESHGTKRAVERDGGCRPDDSVGPKSMRPLKLSYSHFSLWSIPSVRMQANAVPLQQSLDL